MYSNNRQLSEKRERDMEKREREKERKRYGKNANVRDEVPPI